MKAPLWTICAMAHISTAALHIISKMVRPTTQRQDPALSDLQLDFAEIATISLAKLCMEAT